jgi:hypothetical protein
VELWLASRAEIGDLAPVSALRERLEDPSRRDAIVDTCCDLVDAEVAAKRGLAGAAVKTGFKVVNRVKPTMVREVVSGFLPRFADALDPWYARAKEAGGLPQSFERALKAEPDAVAEALLGVTDARISHAGPSVQKAYRSLRGTAEGHVRAAVPGLARALAPFVADA